MKFMEEFQVRGIPGHVSKVKFGKRTVDFWAPRNPGSHVIVAYDGQNVLDKRNIGINPHQRATWELAHSVKRIAELHHIIPPTVICVYHTPYVEDNLGRVKEYTPARYMSRKEDWMLESNGLYRDKVENFIGELNGDQLIEDITERIVPTIANHLGQSVEADKTAILGASMGGLAAIYATIQRPDFFHTTLSFSPHWVIGGNALAEKMMNDFPAPGEHKLWMSRGTKGLDALYEESQNHADTQIRNRGYKDNHNLITRVLNKGAHTNATWARYVPAALNFWLTKG